VQLDVVSSTSRGSGAHCTVQMEVVSSVLLKGAKKEIFVAEFFLHNPILYG
jgi:hypothetical protein